MSLKFRTEVYNLTNTPSLNAPMLFWVLPGLVRLPQPETLE